MMAEVCDLEAAQEQLLELTTGDGQAELLRRAAQLRMAADMAASAAARINREAGRVEAAAERAGEVLPDAR